MKNKTSTTRKAGHQLLITIKHKTSYFRFSLHVSYKRKEMLQTSAHAKNIFASDCFIELESDFVSPKSSKIGRCGASLLTRKFPTRKIHHFKSYEIKHNHVMLNAKLFTVSWTCFNRMARSRHTRMRIAIKKSINIYLMSIGTCDFFNKLLFVNAIFFQWFLII